MASDTEFLNLLHMDTEHHSDIDDLSFFMSGQNTDAVKEETVLLNKMSEDNICKFPARYSYLANKYNLNINFDHCTKLQEFLRINSGDSISIVYASPFLSSPMSYFGHLFLKINKSDNTMFSKIIGYAANIPENTTFNNLITKGIIGDFRGQYSIADYFKIIENYNIIEQRSLVEFKLNLTPNEINKLLLHLYELQGITNRYKYFTNNCGYELSWLLDSAKPSLNIRQELSKIVFPYDIINALDNKKDIKLDIKRSSKIELIFEQYNKLSSHDKMFLKQWRLSKTKIEDINSCNLCDKNTLSYIINSYYDVLFKTQHYVPSDYEDVRTLHYMFPTMDNKNYDNNYAKPHKIILGAYYDNKSVGEELILRPALFNRNEDQPNDLLDGSLDILSVKLINRNNHQRLEEFNIFKIESYTKTFDFYSPPSWRIELAGKQIDNEFIPYIQAGVGASKQISNIFFYGLIQPSIYQNDFDLQYVGGAKLMINKNAFSCDVIKSAYGKNNNSKYNSTNIQLFIPINKEYFILLQKRFIDNSIHILTGIRF